MDKKQLRQFIYRGYSSYKIKIATGKSQTTIRYWLNKYNLKTTHPCKQRGERYESIWSKNGDFKVCPACKKNKSLEEFVKKKSNGSYFSYCKICANGQVKERTALLKQQMILYKGGQCVKCSYNKCNSALEFHHIDPQKKDFTITKMSRYTFNETIKKELDKCILVCANCHREIHAEIEKGKRSVVQLEGQKSSKL